VRLASAIASLEIVATSTIGIAFGVTSHVFGSPDGVSGLVSIGFDVDFHGSKTGTLNDRQSYQLMVNQLNIMLDHCGKFRRSGVVLVYVYMCVCVLIDIVFETAVPSITCPADYQIPADNINQGARIDLNQDIARAIAVVERGAIASIVVSHPSPSSPATLAVGSHTITLTATDNNGQQALCTYNIEVLPVGACCGGATGCVGGVVRTACHEGASWLENRRCSTDCGSSLMSS
jgi:hypothetical protein